MAEPLTAAESEASGKAARTKTPRSALGGWEPPAKRVSAVDTLKRQNKSRVADLVPIRHGRMDVSAFTFYRGAAGIMAGDLAAAPRTDLTVQLCGDAHLSNFGVFAAPDRRLIFDINDFDETHPGPFEWDVKRLAASFEIAGLDRGFKAGDRRSTVARAAGEYRREMRRLAGMRTIDVWYERLDLESLEQFRSRVSQKDAKQYDKALAKAERKNSLRAFDRLTHSVNGDLRIISDPPVIVPVRELGTAKEVKLVERMISDLLDSYRLTLDRDVRHLADGYRYVDLARKVVGVGSVGTRAWIVLLLGRDSQDPLFLQVKEAEASVLEGFAGKSPFKQEGRRVVEGQRLMQAASDIFLGWLTVEKGVDGKPHDYYVRQLWDGKGSAEIETMTPKRMLQYAQFCGWTLARAHARSGDRVAIAAYLGKGDAFDRAMCDFAEVYADQNEGDYKEFRAAIKAGKLKAVTGV
jgi:uncharacterized protein (DUF2252 family)